MEILERNIFIKTVGDCVIEKNTLLKNIMIKVQKLHLAQQHGFSSPGNLEQSK